MLVEWQAMGSVHELRAPQHDTIFFGYLQG